jgi:hypothetical protein
MGESGKARPGAIPAWEAWALSFAIGKSTSDLMSLLHIALMLELKVVVAKSFR